MAKPRSNSDQWKAALQNGDDEQPVWIPEAGLEGITVADVPAGVSISIGNMVDGVIHVTWEGSLYVHGGRFFAAREFLNTRKYWYAPVVLEQHMDLVQRAAEARQRTVGDVLVSDYDDDGAYIRLTYEITTRKTNAGEAFAVAQQVASEVEAAADAAQDEIARRVAEIAGRLSGRHHDEIEALLDQVETATDTHAKGRSLEELMCRLFAQVPGFQVQGRLLTTNEEIDIVMLNGSEDPRFRRDAPLVMVECKNWSGKAGRPDFSAFMAKIENRTGRCTFGVMVSWNGFASTVRDERLRHTKGGILVATMTGDDVRKAIRERDFPSALFAAWQAAVAI